MPWPKSSRSHVLWITQGDTLSQSMRHHGASIENTYWHQPPSIVIQSLGIYDYFMVSPIGQSLLLTLAQTQYPLKVKSLCSIVAWWIMTIDNLVSWSTICPIQFVSHALVHLSWENHPNIQDKPSLQLRDSALQSQMDSPNSWTNYGQLIILQGTHDLDLLCKS